MTCYVVLMTQYLKIVNTIIIMFIKIICSDLEYVGVDFKMTGNQCKLY